MKQVYEFFISLKTAFWIFAILMTFMLIGSLGLPSDLAFFSGIDDEPLLRWLAGNGTLVKTWWIWGILAGLAFMGISTVLCTAEFLLRKLTKYRFLLKISPQVMHIGALLIMLGHLLTASYGFKKDFSLNEGQMSPVHNGVAMRLEAMDLTLDEYGLATDWKAEILVTDAAGQSRKGRLEPASPLFAMGLGFYFKSVAVEEPPAAVIRVCLDPGASWALLGGVLLSLGGVVFLLSRFHGPGRETP